MNWRDKLNPEYLKSLAPLPGKTEALLLGQLPKIREFFASKIGPAFVTAAQNDEKLRVFSESVYSLLPALVRLAVQQESFVQFCFTHRDKLVTPLPTSSQPNPALQRTPTAGNAGSVGDAHTPQ